MVLETHAHNVKTITGEVGEQGRGARRDSRVHQYRRSGGGVVHEEGPELQPAHGAQTDR